MCKKRSSLCGTKECAARCAAAAHQPHDAVPHSKAAVLGGGSRAARFVSGLTLLTMLLISVAGTAQALSSCLLCRELIRLGSGRGSTSAFDVGVFIAPETAAPITATTSGGPATAQIPAVAYQCQGCSPKSEAACVRSCQLNFNHASGAHTRGRQTQHLGAGLASVLEAVVHVQVQPYQWPSAQPHSSTTTNAGGSTSTSTHMRIRRILQRHIKELGVFSEGLLLVSTPT